LGEDGNGEEGRRKKEEGRKVTDQINDTIQVSS
jgi:hypothetical protein